MASFRNLNKTCTVMAFALLFCWGCVSPGPTGPDSDAAAQNGAAAAKPPVSPVGNDRVAGADRLEDVQVVDEPDKTVIRLSANKPLQDYEFRRAGENRFELNVGDLPAGSAQPMLPGGSKRVKLSYGSGPRFQIVGEHPNHLDHYVVNRVENELIVAVYFTRESIPKSKAAFKTAGGSKVAKTVPSEVESRSYGSASEAPIIPPMPQPKSSAARSLPARGAAAQAAAPDPAPRYDDKTVSLDMVDADLKNVLRLIADITGANIVIEPDVTGKVTLKVEKVPWRKVLKLVLSMNELGMVEDGNVIRVAKLDKLKKDEDRKLEAYEMEIKRKNAEEAVKELGEVSTVYLTVNYAKPEEIANKLNEIKSERGKAIVDERTSLIIYTDYPSRIEKARQLLGRLDKPTPQVLIEARIVTMKTETARDLGISWTFASANSSFAQAFSVNHPASGALDKYTFGVGGLIGKTAWSLDAQLSALETSTDLKIIAAPKVMTLNNVKATVAQGTQIPYAQPSTVGGVGVATSTIFKDATIQLDVTPHVTPDKRVRMQIEAKQDTPGTVTYSGGVGIDTRKVTTELLVDDGNIVVIGGVLSDTTNISKEGTPGLSKVPVLGRLFKRDNETTNRMELLIFISPKIVEAQRTSG